MIFSWFLPSSSFFSSSLSLFLSLLFLFFFYIRRKLEKWKYKLVLYNSWPVPFGWTSSSAEHKKP